MLPVVKRFIELSLVGSGVERLARNRRNNQTLVLAYHNILPKGKTPSGERSLHLPQAEFARQLDAILSTHEVVPLSQIARPVAHAAKPRVAITFDDAYAGAMTAGVEELARRSMPATVFVAPGLLNSVTWWDAFADPVTGVLDEARRATTLGDMAGRVPDDMMPAGQRALERIADEGTLRSASEAPGITFGSHSWSHAELTRISNADLESELLRPLEWLSSRFACFIPWFSYPYGRFNDRVADAVTQAGYEGACMIEGGWFKSVGASVRLPRFNVPAGLSLNGFRLRLAGLGTGN